MMTPEEYCAAYSRVVSISHPLLENSEMVASGPTWATIDSSRRFFASFNSRAPGWCKRLDGYSLHYYSIADGHDDTFTEAEWYQSLFDSIGIQEVIEDHLSILKEFDPKRHVGLFIDEWGHWTTLNSGGPWTEKPMYSQIGTMREALVAAIMLNIFNNYCDVVKMANLTALINYIHCLFVSEDEKLIVTPTYHVFNMMKEHQNAACIRTVCASETHNGLQRVTASASVKAGKTLLTLVNTQYSDPVDVTVELHNGLFPADIRIETLVADDPHASNTFENPSAVCAVREFTSAGAGGHELQLTLPAASVVCLSYQSGEEASLNGASANQREVRRPRIKTIDMMKARVLKG